MVIYLQLRVFRDIFKTPLNKNVFTRSFQFELVNFHVRRLYKTGEHTVLFGLVLFFIVKC